MKKVSVEIEIPEDYEFVGFSESMRNEKVDGDFMLYACPRIAILRPIKKKQIIFTSTGKKRIPEKGEYFLNDSGHMMCSHAVTQILGAYEIYSMEVKWV